MLPIPFFAFREIYEQLARADWADIGQLPAFDLVDTGLVLSALAHPFATAGGYEVYPTVPGKAAALFRGLVKNHGLHDGNKRLAVTTMTAFLLSNGWWPLYSNLQLYRYALRVARHEGNYPVPTIERWLRRNSSLMPDRDLAFVRRQNRRIRRESDVLAAALSPVLLPPGWLDSVPEETVAKALADLGDETASD